jgi:hypothetical protein
MVEIISGGNMLDQNLTTVLTTLITVLGTLGGVVLGVVLSNRYVARQEQAKKSSAVIEEVYMLALQIIKWVDAVSEDMGRALPSTDTDEDRNTMYDLKVNHRDEIYPAIDRITTLVRLHIPQANKYTEEKGPTKKWCIALRRTSDCLCMDRW